MGVLLTASAGRKAVKKGKTILGLYELKRYMHSI